MTNTTAASKYIPKRPRISINWNPPFRPKFKKKKYYVREKWSRKVVPSRGLWGGSYHSRQMLALWFYIWTLYSRFYYCNWYTNDNKRQNFGFHLPQDDRTALGGVQLGLITLSYWHPLGVQVLFFRFWRIITQKNVLYPIPVLPWATLSLPLLL